VTQVSSAIFDKILGDRVSDYSWSILGIGIVSVFMPLYLPLFDVIQRCRKSNRVLAREQNYDEEYDDIRTKFSNEYDRSNPVTKDGALKDYFSFMRSKRRFTHR
jgi:hypothetical protein